MNCGIARNVVCASRWPFAGGVSQAGPSACQKHQQNATVEIEGIDQRIADGLLIAIPGRRRRFEWVRGRREAECQIEVGVVGIVTEAQS